MLYMLLPTKEMVRGGDMNKIKLRIVEEWDVLVAHAPQKEVINFNIQINNSKTSCGNGCEDNIAKKAEQCRCLVSFLLCDIASMWDELSRKTTFSSTTNIVLFIKISFVFKAVIFHSLF